MVLLAKRVKKSTPKKIDERITDLPGKSQSVYNTYKDALISGITVYRKPVSKVVQSILNFTAPGLKEAEKKLGYDEIFHLGAVIKIKGGPSLIVEKLQNVRVARGGVPSGAETITVPVNREMTLSDLFTRLIVGVGKEAFYRYSAFSTNCQHFIRNLLAKSGLLNEESRKFIMQDVAQLVKAIPSRVQDATQLVTDFAAVLERLIS
jgi:hypothetical protein